jgi:N utilization substance protein A
MEHAVLIESFQEFKDYKNIDRATMMSILEDVFRNMARKKFGPNANINVVINIDKGDFEIWRSRTIVEDGMVEDESTQIAYSDAIKIQPDFEIGEEVTEEVPIYTFGRRAIQAALQNLKARVTDLEKDGIYRKYKDRVGEIVTGEVYQVWKREMLVLDDEGHELILPKDQMIPADFYKKGDPVKAVVLRVEMHGSTPRIILSRTAPVFLERLFELEVPEVFDGLITIKKVVREPGERAKVAVESYDDRIDPVGACVGMKGSRILGIVKELRNENIDVINYTNNIQLYIQRALSPAKITSIKIDEENKKASVFMRPDQVSLIRLAGKLTGYEIDVYRDGAEDEEDEEDVDLDEFKDEIDEWIIEELKKIGCDTAKSVLKLSVEELVNRTDLEEETIQDVIKILKSEFE